MVAEKSHAFERAQEEYEKEDWPYADCAKRETPQQFYQLYFARLMQLKQRLKDSATSVWPSTSIGGILDCSESTESALIATVYKQMRLKPTVLDEYAEDRSVSSSINSTRLTSPDDAVYLEDEHARIMLQPADDAPVSLQPHQLITGVVLALKGKVHNGSFHAHDVLFPAPSIPRYSLCNSLVDASADASADASYALVVSGLHAGGSATASVQLLLNFISGDLGSASDRQLARNIARVVVAGNSADVNEQTTFSASAQATAVHATGSTAKRRERERERSRAEHRLHDMDALLAQIARICPTDVMPGASDPAHLALPQPPLHAALLPHARSHICPATNPHAFKLKGLRFVGTSGQNITDMLTYTDLGGPIDCLAKVLQWQHLAPSAPDTLPCHPSRMFDPLVLEQCPDVLFAGNQQHYAAWHVEGSKTTLVSVPSFSATGTAVLINLHDMSTTPITFEAAQNTERMN